MKNRIISNLKRGLFIALSLLFSAAIYAQSSANFSGTWSYNESKSNLGGGGTRMISSILVISQGEESLNLERTFTGQNGEERKMSENYKLDGKESVNPIFNTSKKSTVKWSSDKKSLTISSVMVFEMNGEQNEIKTVEVYSLADSGATLSIDSQSVSSMGERKAMLIYDKK